MKQKVVFLNKKQKTKSKKPLGNLCDQQNK